jgi:hypothetical protein
MVAASLACTEIRKKRPAPRRLKAHEQENYQVVVEGARVACFKYARACAAATVFGP